MRYVAVLIACLAALSARGERVTLFDSHGRGQSAGCTAHIVSRTAGSAVTAPCGVPVDVPFADPIGYISRGWEINPSVADLARGGEFVLDRFVPAASVSLVSDLELSPAQRAIVISFAAPHERVFQHPVTEAGGPRRVPAGRAVAVIVDQHDHVVRMSPVVSVAHRGSAVLRLERGGGAASLIAFIGAPPAPHPSSELKAIELVDARGTHKPEAQVVGSDMIVVLWDELEDPARVVLDSPTLWLPNSSVTPSSRGPATLRESLRVRPTLSVDVGEIARFPDLEPEMSLALRNPATGSEESRVLNVAPGGTYTFRHLAPAAYQAALQVDGFVITTPADLSSGEDARVKIALEPLEVAGRVFRGRVPVQAELRFVQAGKPVQVKTLPDGSFRTVVWRRARYFVDVVPNDDPVAPPYRELVSITRDVTLELRIPAKRLEARVFDASTRQPLTGARVTVHNTFLDAGGKSASNVYTAVSAEGVATLPPVREGTAEIHVTADGYASPAPLSLAIDATEGVQSVELPMRRNEETPNFEVKLADGRPAAGAELVIVSPAGTLLPWAARAGSDGRAFIPAEAERNFVLVRHPESASAAVRVASRAAIPPVHLGPAAPPLLVEVVGADGRRIGPVGALLTLWHGELTLTGAAAAFFAGATAVTTTDGMWIARNLPRAAVRIAAARTHGRGAASAESFGTTIPYPWPPIVTIRVID